MPVDQQLGGGNVSTADTWPGLDLPPGIGASQAIGIDDSAGRAAAVQRIEVRGGGGMRGLPACHGSPALPLRSPPPSAACAPGTTPGWG